MVTDRLRAFSDRLLACFRHFTITKPGTIHWDTTSFYFEGVYEDSDLARYGCSPDQHTGVKQAKLGLSVTSWEQMPLLYRVLAGNGLDHLRRRLNTGKYRKRDEAVKQLANLRWGNPAKSLVDVGLSGTGWWRVRPKF